MADHQSIKNIISKSYKKLLISIFVLFIVCITLYSYIYPIYQMHTIEIFLATSLPENAHDLKYYIDTWQRTILFLRFELSPDYTLRFLSKLCFKNDDLKLDNLPDMMDFKASWWIPEGSQNAVGGRCFRNDGSEFKVVIDKSDVFFDTIYLQGFES